MKLTLKKINLFRPNTLIVDGDDEKTIGKAPAVLGTDGYYTLDKGTYEMVLDQEVYGNIPPVRSVFIQNSVLIYAKAYQTPEGSATLISVKNGYLKIKPGTIISYDIEQDAPFEIPEGTVDRAKELFTNEQIQPKRKPGRPKKIKD